MPWALCYRPLSPQSIRTRPCARPRHPILYYLHLQLFRLRGRERFEQARNPYPATHSFQSEIPGPDLFYYNCLKRHQLLRRSALVPFNRSRLARAGPNPKSEIPNLQSRTSVICARSSVLGLLSSVFCHLSSVICHLFSRWH
jgi:hypothetical protein